MKRMVVSGMFISLILMGCQSSEEEATTIVENYLNVLTESSGDVDEEVSDLLHPDAGVDEESINDFEIGNPEMVELEYLELEYVKVPFNYSNDSEESGDDEYIVTDTGNGMKIIIGGVTLDSLRNDELGVLAESRLETYDQELFNETYESKSLKEEVHGLIQED